jgi:hypothetical protein
MTDTIQIRVPRQALSRTDEAARRLGLSRSAYWRCAAENPAAIAAALAAAAVVI